MTSNSNHVFQVLPTANNLAVLAAGSQPSALAVGQIGFFSLNDHISIDGTAQDRTREFYIAVGVDPNGTGSVQDIIKSAGQSIQKDNITALAMRCYSPSREEVWDITDFAVKCDTEYGIRVEVNSQQAYALYGYNTPFKTFIVKSNCCTDDCATCPEGDGNDLAKKLVDAVNADPDKLMVASFIDYTTTPGTNIAVAYSGYAAWVADPANADKHLGVRITTAQNAKKSYSQINLMYDNSRQNFLNVSFATGFNCNGTITKSVTGLAEQGSGYDLAQLEYQAGGWNGRPGPYRVSSLVNMPIGDYTTYVDKSGKYVICVITHDHESKSGFKVYTNNLQTIVAIPCADTVTRTSFFTILDAIIAGKFEALLNDNAACPGDCVTVNLVSGKALTTDGLG